MCKKCRKAAHPKNPDSPWITRLRLEAVPTATLCIWHKQDSDSDKSKDKD
jgi:hypothetical protein